LMSIVLYGGSPSMLGSGHNVVLLGDVEVFY
jgi:hypothetical protein